LGPSPKSSPAGKGTVLRRAGIEESYAMPVVY
jgi:hypothetical protein